MALCLYAVNFPYLLLMITSPFFRRRFHIWLGIESASVPSAEPRDVSGS
jgi:hypothetical protein